MKNSIVLGKDKSIIGNIKLEEYQVEAIEKVYSYIYNILTDVRYINNIKPGNLKDRSILLHAPVGSGKTIMGAFIVNFMKAQMKELGYRKAFSFIWASPDTGGINKQSQNSFESVLRDVDVVDIQSAKTSRKINKDEILFINWEKIKNDKNILMRENTERVNFIDIMNNTLHKKILIIDEAHIDWTNDGESDIISLINPDLVLYLTATPDDKLGLLKNKVFIPYNIVQEAGVIKSQVVVNDGISEDEDFQESINRSSSNPLENLLSIEEKLISKAIKKRDFLENLIIKEGNDPLVPLVIIQIPNVNSLEAITQKSVKSFLLKKGVHKDKIATWLANTKENIEDMNNNKTEFIITKEAITTGWNVVRAHILVKLRQTGSKNFDLQTLGRIMRVPRGYNFSCKELNTAYVFTPHPSFSYKAKTHKAEKNSIDELINNSIEVKLKDDFKNEVGVLGIPMFKKIMEKDIYIKSNVLYSTIDKFLRSIDYNLSHEAFLKIKTEECFYEMEEDHNMVDGLANHKLNYEELEQLFNLNVNKISPIVYINEYIIDTFSKIFDLNNEPYLDSLNYIYTLFYNNIDDIRVALEKTLNEYRLENNIVKDQETVYKVVEKTFYGEIKKRSSKRYSYEKEPNLINKSSPEHKFSIFLNNNENVRYWFKNGIDKKRDFSIVYTHNNKVREYYPDFFVFDKNNNLYILDTKSNFEDSDFDDTSEKYLAGLKYEKNKKVKQLIKDLGLNNIRFSLIKYADEKSITPKILTTLKYYKDNEENPKAWTNFKL